MSSFGPLHRLSFVLVSFTIVMAACQSDSLAPGRRARLLRDGVSRAESLAAISIRSRARPSFLLDPDPLCALVWDDPNDVVGCVMSTPQVTPDDPWLLHSGGIYETAQTDPIHIKFDGPIHGVSIVSTGALKCTGSIGRLVGYFNGDPVDSAVNQLADPDDCGEDDVTFGVVGGLMATTAIDSLIIEGVGPWTFDVSGVPGGRALLRYTVNFAPGWACSGTATAMMKASPSIQRCQSRGA